MSEQKAEEKNSSEKIYPTPLKRFILTVIGLFVFVILFGEIVPRLMFKKEDKTVANIEENSGKTTTIDPVADQPARPESSSIISPPPDNTETTISEPAVSDPVASTMPPANGTEPAVTQLSEKDKEHLQELEEKITSLQAAHEATINEMQKKLEDQNTDNQHKADSVISSLIIFGQLKDAVSNGKPYAGELEQLKKFTNNNTDITAEISLIEPDAATGIVVLDKLKIRFTPLIKQALTNKDESAMLKILHKFVTIRKVGEQSGSSDEAIFARAEMKLAQNDLSTVLSELEQLSPPAKEIFKDWIKDTQKLLDIQKTLNDLQLLLTQTNKATHP